MYALGLQGLCASGPGHNLHSGMKNSYENGLRALSLFLGCASTEFQLFAAKNERSAVLLAAFPQSSPCLRSAAGFMLHLVRVRVSQLHLSYSVTLSKHCLHRPGYASKTVTIECRNDPEDAFECSTVTR
jgi:hypothetical protein